jgi:hypothetical protein
MSQPLSAIEEAERAGFDPSLIDANLSYSYGKDRLAAKELRAIREKLKQT